MRPITEYAFTRQTDRTILVVGGAGDYTIVPDPQGARCTCPAGVYRGRCKHLARAGEIFNDVVLRIHEGIPGAESAQELAQFAPLAEVRVDADLDELSAAITEENRTVVNRCEEKLAALEVRTAPGALMAKYRAARERIAAEKVA